MFNVFNPMIKAANYDPVEVAIPALSGLASQIYGTVALAPLEHRVGKKSIHRLKGEPKIILNDKKVLKETGPHMWYDKKHKPYVHTYVRNVKKMTDLERGVLAHEVGHSKQKGHKLYIAGSALTPISFVMGPRWILRQRSMKDAAIRAGITAIPGSYVFSQEVDASNKGYDPFDKKKKGGIHKYIGTPTYFAVGVVPPIAALAVAANRMRNPKWRKVRV